VRVLSGSAVSLKCCPTAYFTRPSSRSPLTMSCEGQDPRSLSQGADQMGKHSHQHRRNRPLVQTWAELAEEDNLLEDALIYFGRSRDWFDIYKALECLMMRAGGERAFLAWGWVPEDVIMRIKRTANSARHARRKYEPPPNPMDVKEAHSVVGRLLRRALKEGSNRGS
jgi:hypothetical protein